MRYFVVLLFILTQCATAFNKDDLGLSDSSGHWYACREACLDDYPTTKGVKVWHIRPGTLRCRCLRSRGDKTIYLGIAQYEADEETKTEQFSY